MYKLLSKAGETEEKESPPPPTHTHTEKNTHFSQEDSACVQLSSGQERVQSYMSTRKIIKTVMEGE